MRLFQSVLPAELKFLEVIARNLFTASLTNMTSLMGSSSKRGGDREKEKEKGGGWGWVTLDA